MPHLLYCSGNKTGEDMITKSMYKIIQQNKRQGYSKSAISDLLSLDPRTVSKYYSMDESTYRTYRLAHQYREKVFDDYESSILEVYRANENRPLNMTAVYDYLEERYGPLPGNEQTLRNYIRYLIATDQLQLNHQARIYTPVPDLPFGRQLQVDFGQWRCSSGLLLYIFGAVLSASRYKYVMFQDRPLQTRTVIEHLLECFDYIGGVPRELVVDQDHLLVVSENAGDIIYTQEFKSFIDEQSLTMYVCRKADPESKGKVENLIKYVKQNFLSVRDFQTLEDATTGLREWLDRRANGKISQATRQIPAEVWNQERTHLRSLRHSIFRKDSLIEREDRTANANACISVEACLYQLPSRYRNTLVEIYLTAHQVFVFDRVTGQEIVEYDLSPIPGKTICKRAFKRSSSHTTTELKKKVLTLFPGELWQQFLKHNFSKLSRYVRDQCLEARRYFQPQKIDDDILDQALSYCIEHETFSMANLNDTYHYFERESARATVHETARAEVAWNPGRHDNHAPLAITKRSIDEYKALIQQKGYGVK